MGFRHVWVDVESGHIGCDEVEGCLGFWWDIDAQVKRGL